MGQATSAGPRGLLIAAPASGSGKTVLTLALLRALRERGISVSGAKAGPDYIDPAFHEIACGTASVNLDPWAMRAARLLSLANNRPGELLLIEAMMGLYDGAADGTGSAADLAVLLGVPVVLVVDAAKLSHSIAALVRGFRDHRGDVRLAGVILNNVGSARHERMLREALAALNMPVLGAIPRRPELQLPERHLGLVQAGEQAGIEAFVRAAAACATAHCDLAAIAALARPLTASKVAARGVPPLGQCIAIACDTAFSFCYPHWFADWRAAGAELRFFSPLADERPGADSDAVLLPGGYPELHAGRLAACRCFHAGMDEAAERGAAIYGECGGFMVLGEGIEDKAGERHRMLGLLAVETSFARPKLHLGYRRVKALSGAFAGQFFTAHEFHYTEALKQAGDPLFAVDDARGAALGMTGLARGNISGSYLHLIDGVAS